MPDNSELPDDFCEKTAAKRAEQQYGDNAVGTIRFMMYDAGGPEVGFIWTAKVGDKNYRFYGSEEEAIGCLVIRGIERVTKVTMPAGFGTQVVRPQSIGRLRVI